MTDKQRYKWADRGRDGGAEALCLTVLAGRSEAEVLTALNVDPTSRRDATFAEGEDAWTDDVQPVQIWTDAAHVVLVEPNGYQAWLPEVLLRLVGPGDAVVIYWNVNANARVLVVRGGTIVRELDPVTGDAEHEPLPEEHGLDFDGDEWRSAMCVLLERLTGFVASREAILEPRRPTYPVPTR